MVFDLLVVGGLPPFVLTGVPLVLPIVILMVAAVDRCIPDTQGSQHNLERHTVVLPLLPSGQALDRTAGALSPHQAPILWE